MERSIKIGMCMILLLLILPSVNAATVFEDDFDRTNSATVGNGWTEVESGGNTFKIESNTLEMVTAGAALSIMYQDIGNQSQFIAAWQMTYNSFAQSYQLWINAPDNSTELGYRFLHDNNFDTLGIAVKNETVVNFENHAGWAEPIDPGETWNFQLSKNSTHLRLKLWDNNDPEPSNYNMSIYVQNITMPNLGNIKWHLGNGATPGIDVNVDNFIVENTPSFDYGLTVTASYINNASSINSFNTSFYYGNGTLISENSTTTGSIFFDIDEVNNYTIEFDNPAFTKPKNYTFEFDNTTGVSHNFQVLPALTANIAFYDEETKNLITGQNVTLDLIGTYFSNNYSTLTGYLNVTVGYPDNYVVRYQGETYDRRFYDFDLAEYQYINLSLYLLADAENITATVIDEYLNELEGAIILVQKYDIESNTYITVERVPTNFEGKAVFKAKTNDEFYRFIVYYNGEIVFNSDPTILISDTITLPAVVTTPTATGFYKLGNIDYLFTFNNDTNNFKLIYADATGATTTMKLKTWQIKTAGDELLNETTTTASSGTMLHHVQNITGYYYKSCAYAYFDSDYELLDCAYADFGSDIPEEGSKLALFILILLTIVLAMAAIFDPVIALVIIALPWILFELIGLTTIGLQYAISVEILLIIVALIIGRSR